MSTNDLVAPTGKRKILVTNDDGITAPGLITLCEELIRDGSYEVKVSSPATQQSAQSHSISLHEPLYAEPYELPKGLSKDIDAWCVFGSPADCTKIALTSKVFEGWKPDLVVSGINAGSNSGMSCHYSGTVAAAREANIYGVPSIALSLQFPKRGSLWCFRWSAEKSVEVINAHFAQWDNPDTLALLKHTCINVNFPNISPENQKGFLVTKQGRSNFDDWYVEEELNETEQKAHPTRRRFRLEGRLNLTDPDVTFDTKAMKEGYISVTALGLSHQDQNSIDVQEKMGAWSLFKGSE